MRNLLKMSARRPLVVGLTLAVTLTSGVVVASQTSANAAPPACRGATCSGKDPDAAGCGRDAVTTAQKPFGFQAPGKPERWIQLRYSSACQANWARVVDRRGTWTTISVYNNRGEHRDNWRGSTRKMWTPMVNGLVLAQACTDDAFGDNVCTNWA